MKTKKTKSNDVQITVKVDRRTRDRLKVLGAMNGHGLSREACRRLTASVDRDKIIIKEIANADLN